MIGPTVRSPDALDRPDSKPVESSLAAGGSAYAALKLARLTRRLGQTTSVELTRLQMMGILTALELQSERETHLDPALASLRESLKRALLHMAP